MSTLLPSSTILKGYEKVLNSFLVGSCNRMAMISTRVGARTFTSVARSTSRGAALGPPSSFLSLNGILGSDHLALCSDTNNNHHPNKGCVFGTQTTQFFFSQTGTKRTLHTSTTTNSKSGFMMMGKKHSSTRFASSSSNLSDAVGNNVLEAMEALRHADAVCFDVDSTVITEEGIDVLADSLGKGAEVAAWTSKAMDGGVKFEDALAARLDIIKPSKSSIEQCLKDHPLVLSEGVEEFTRALQQRGTHVYLVSGGFRLMIEPVAKHLDIPKDRIYANTIWFDTDGNYAGFDANEPTSADGGKPKALRQIESKGNYKSMIMVGDGATDAQAKPPAKAFIGFGGVIVRETVKAKACWYVTDFNHLINIVKNNS